MGRSRYVRYVHLQPVRKISTAITDIEHVITQFETLDQLSYKYYGDATMEYVIMCANPDCFLSFDIPAGTKLRIPFPISRVFSEWGGIVEI